MAVSARWKLDMRHARRARVALMTLHALCVCDARLMVGVLRQDRRPHGIRGVCPRNNNEEDDDDQANSVHPMHKGGRFGASHDCQYSITEPAKNTLNRRECSYRVAHVFVWNVAD